MNRDAPECEHCEGEGTIWEPCHVGYEHEYQCTCAEGVRYPPCANCGGTGKLNP